MYRKTKQNKIKRKFLSLTRLFWCWLQELICSCADIVPADDPPNATTTGTSSASSCSISSITLCQQTAQKPTPPNPSAMFRTIAGLIDILLANEGQKQQQPSRGYTATITKTSDYFSYFKATGIHLQRTSIAQRSKTTKIDNKNEYNNDIDSNEIASNDDCIEQISCLTNCVPNSITNTKTIYSQNDNNSFDATNACDDINTECNHLKCDRPNERRRKTPNSLNLNLSNRTEATASSQANAIKKRKLSTKVSNSSKFMDSMTLNGIVEECEYDSDIGKFNCKINDQTLSDNSSDSNKLSFENFNSNEIEHFQNDRKDSIDRDDVDGSGKIVSKRIEFFENGSNRKIQCDKPKQNEICDNSIASKSTENDQPTEDKMFSTIFCLVAFFSSVIGLYFFPLPS